MLVVELVPVIVDRAIGLLRGHVLRAGDAIQLASCLHLRDAFEADVTFVAFDERLVAAARKERLRLA
jgi:predicted nucleic acid-binding protein